MAEARRRVRQVYARSKNYYFLEYDAAAGEVLDAGLCGSKLRFVNHSCEPNCYFEKWLLSGSEEDRNAEYQLGLFALRDIDAGEELTYNYGWTAFQAPHVDQHGQWVLGERCLCGTPSCTGWLARPPKKRVLLARNAPAEVTTAPPIPARASEPVRTREARAQRRMARLTPNRAAPPSQDALHPPAVRHSLRTRRTPSMEPVQVQERLRTRATAVAMATATTHSAWASPSPDEEASDEPRHDAEVKPPLRKRGWPKGRPRPRKKQRGWPKGRPRKIEAPPSETPTLGSSEPPDTSPEPEPLTPLVLLFEPESPVLPHTGVPYAWDVPLFVPADEASAAAAPCVP
ncbi:hypothetical protein MNAN1_002112 [Malassezia nana]|uniref:Uncharacterized protein n=1 Tax=Malassezia nana TaxID=180528 RepID=A0AAF0ELP3_9BASI|nr:hypothetical protein MNAN1_002112 [Malassezia nana]